MPLGCGGGGAEVGGAAGVVVGGCVGSLAVVVGEGLGEGDRATGGAWDEATASTAAACGVPTRRESEDGLPVTTRTTIAPTNPPATKTARVTTQVGNETVERDRSGKAASSLSELRQTNGLSLS